MNIVTTGFNPLQLSGNRIKCRRHGAYYTAKLGVHCYGKPNSMTLIVWAEPTVLCIICRDCQRIKIRCYNIGRGYASIICYLTNTELHREP